MKAIVKRPADLTAGPPTPGMQRLEAFAADDRWIGRAGSEPGVVSGWHHHGRHDTYFYVLAGGARLEFEDGEVLEVGAGNFAHVPAGVIHREGTLGDATFEAVVVRIGSGPQVFEVNDPG
jgi:quercetin dioxygenase-like cupin family protein